MCFGGQRFPAWPEKKMKMKGRWLNLHPLPTHKLCSRKKRKKLGMRPGQRRKGRKGRMNPEQRRKRKKQGMGPGQKRKEQMKMKGRR